MMPPVTMREIRGAAETLNRFLDRWAKNYANLCPPFNGETYDEWEDQEQINQDDFEEGRPPRYSRICALCGITFVPEYMRLKVGVRNYSHFITISKTNVLERFGPSTENYSIWPTCSDECCELFSRKVRIQKERRTRKWETIAEYKNLVKQAKCLIAARLHRQ
jgi:hypothetical protein